MKRYLKTLISIISAVFIMSAFSQDCFAAEDSFSFFNTDSLLEAVPDYSSDLLDELGISKIDFESVFSVDIKDFFNLFKKLITGAFESPLSSLVRLIAIIVLLALSESFIPDDHNRQIVEIIGNLLCILSIISPLSFTLTSAVASISASEGFMLTLIPILTAIVSVSGNPTLATSFQAVAFAAAQVITFVAEYVIVPVVGAILALDITSSLMPVFSLSGLTGFIKKTITTVLSLGASVFVSFLGIKGALSNAADTVAAKGIKLVIGSAVPVVGGALSEAYDGIMGSIVLVRSTVGIIGICLIALVSLPSIIQLLFWIFTLRLASSVAELFEQKMISSFLKAMASSIILLNVVILFVAVLFIIATALLLVIRAE